MQTLRQLKCRVPVVVLVLVLFAWPALPQAEKEQPSTIVFMTDFGTVDDSVAICKGVMYEIDPAVRIVDLTHQVTPFSIVDGARFLQGTTPYYPVGTVFVVVIDPGVGTSRKAIVAKSKRGQYFVLPDNGLMTLVEQQDGIEAVREITNPGWMVRSRLSSTFHGRDIFSPVGAHLARGDDWKQVGPELQVKELVRLDLKPAKVDEHGVSGTIIATDGPFGNLVTNVGTDEFLELGYQHGDAVPVTLGTRQMRIPYVPTFGAVALGKPLLYMDSRGHLALAINQGNFAEKYAIRPPVRLFIPKKAK